MAKELIRVADTTIGKESIVTLLADDSPAFRESRSQLSDVVQRLVEASSEPTQDKQGTVIRFTAGEVTGTIELSNGLNPKQEKALQNAGISYEKSATQPSNDINTNKLIENLKKFSWEPATLPNMSWEEAEVQTAYKQASREIQQILLPGRADPNIPDQETGKLPLQLALERETKLRIGFPQDVATVIPALIEHGADPFKKNAHGQSAMDTARELGRTDVIEYFQQHAKDRHSSLEQSPLQNALAQAGAEMGGSLRELKDYQINPQGNSTEIGRAGQQGGKGKPGPRTLTV